MKRSVIDIIDLTTDEINSLIETAVDIIENPDKYREACKYKKLATLFLNLPLVPVLALKRLCRNWAVR